MGDGVRVSHLLDTCALLDLVAGRWNDPDGIKTLESAAKPAVLSLSGWEIARKFRLGKLTLPCKADELEGFLDAVFTHYQLSWVSVTAEIALRAEKLPMHHKDPVDRMILSFAQVHKVPVVTSDRVFDQYDVQILRHRN
jgi:PIN domain nuclease of toxin-antitoxin system